MPRLIDRDSRREQYAEAVWRVIEQEGVGAVSVRRVAAEAGVSPGAIRHLFPRRVDFLEFALRLAAIRVVARVSAAALIGDPLDQAVRVLEELLPLDEARRPEFVVQLGLMAEAPAHPYLAEVQRETDEAIARFCRGVVEKLAAAGLVHESRDSAFEARLLHALLDGLALQLLSRGIAFQAAAKSMLRAFLTALATAKDE